MPYGETPLEQAGQDLETAKAQCPGLPRGLLERVMTSLVPGDRGVPATPCPVLVPCVPAFAFHGLHVPCIPSHWLSLGSLERIVTETKEGEISVTDWLSPNLVMMMTRRVLVAERVWK